jgi:hypothetical protein
MSAAPGLLPRFWSKVTADEAHRLAYEALVGEVPEGLVLDHLCRNPEHMEPVPVSVNTARGGGYTATAARMESCKRGHQFDDRNTAIVNGTSRRCRSCQRDARRRERQAGL